MLTAKEFIEQGTSASQVLSIAKFLNSTVLIGDKEYHIPNPNLASKVRVIAEEVARETGINLYTQRTQRRNKGFHKKRK